MNLRVTPKETVPGGVALPSIPPAQKLTQSDFFWKFLLPLFDALILFSLCLAFSYVRLGSDEWALQRPAGFASALIFIGCIIGMVSLTGGYRQPEQLRTLARAAEFLLASGLGTFVAFFVMFVVFLGVDVVPQSRSVLVLSAVAFVPLGLGVRQVAAGRRVRSAVLRPYLFLGSAGALKEFLEIRVRSGLENPVVASVTSGRVADSGGCQLMDLCDIDWSVARHLFAGIVLDNQLTHIPAELQTRLMRMHFSELPVHKMTAFFASLRRQVPTLNINADWFFECEFTLSERSYYRFLKRAADVLLSIILLILTLPLSLLVSMLVLVESRGGIFFSQDRVGLNGKVFRLIKFRTMVSGSEEGDAYTSREDERITRIGRWLRISRIDELPQLWNVLTGDMSLIGPRPEWTRLVREYEEKIPFYHFRHLVKPGLTGWAQLNYPYGASLSDTIEKLRYDLYYIEFYTPALDIEIVLKTILHVASLKGR